MGQDGAAVGEHHPAIAEPLDAEGAIHRNRVLETHARRAAEVTAEQPGDVAAAGGIARAAETTPDGDGLGLGDVHGVLPWAPTDRKRGARDNNPPYQ